MRKPLTAIIAVVLLLGLVFCLIWFSQAPAPMNRPAQSSEATGSNKFGNIPASNVNEPAAKPEPAPANTPKARENKPAETAQPLPAPVAPLVVAGRVIDIEADVLVPGAAVTLTIGQEVFKTVTDNAGEFRFELAGRKELPAEAILSASTPEIGTGKVKAEPGDGNLIWISDEGPPTILVVRVEGNGIPEKTWLTWERGEEQEPLGDEFDEGKNAVRIEISKPKNENRGACRACTQWFGKLLQSEPITLAWGKEQEVVLKPPAGATLKVSVLNCNGPMAGVDVEVRGKGLMEIRLRTGEDGMATMGGVPAPLDFRVLAVEAPDGTICAGAQPVSFGTVSDVREVVFDFSDCGIVDCKLTSGKEVLTYLVVSGEGLREAHVWLWRWKTDVKVSRIYGLKPGRYEVKCEGNEDGVNQEFKAAFEVVAPPAISNWHHAFETFSVTIHARGAPEPGLLRLWAESMWSSNTEAIAPDSTGTFVLKGLGEQGCVVHIAGGGYASRVVDINPTKSKEVDIEVERAGVARVSARDTSRQGPMGWIEIVGIEPEQPVLKVYCPKSSKDVLLVPGRYRLTTSWSDTAPWQPLEFTVRAGETTDCAFGPEFTCRLIIHMTNRGSLPSGAVKIKQNGHEVKHRGSHTMRGNGDEFYNYRFEAEGKLTLTITVEGYETFEKEFEVARGQEYKLDYEPKPLK